MATRADKQRVGAPVSVYELHLGSWRRHEDGTLLTYAEAAPLLRAMGLLHRDASMPPRQVRKYWQVSHMVTLLGAQVISEYERVDGRGAAAPARPFTTPSP